MNKITRLKLFLNLWRILPTYIIVKLNQNSRLMEDIQRWSKILEGEISGFSSSFWVLAYFLCSKMEFRNLLIFRYKKKTVIACILSLLWNKMPNLYIYTDDIGGGLFIQHGFSTIINAVSIGRNCSIGQQITIGNNGNDKPIIKDNVIISAGAIVIGKVTIHDNSLIGAGAVVTHDVPQNAVVAGVPAKVIKWKE